MNIKTGIEKAIHEGYYYGLYTNKELKTFLKGNPFDDILFAFITNEAVYDDSDSSWISYEQFLLDPEFWKALGKSEKWKDQRENYHYEISWKEKQHKLIDHIIEGKSLEEAFDLATS